MKTVVFEVDDRYAGVVVAACIGTITLCGSTETNVSHFGYAITDGMKIVIDADGQPHKVEEEQHHGDKVKGCI